MSDQFGRPVYLTIYNCPHRCADMGAERSEAPWLIILDFLLLCAASETTSSGVTSDIIRRMDFRCHLPRREECATIHSRFLVDSLSPSLLCHPKSLSHFVVGALCTDASMLHMDGHLASNTIKPPPILSQSSLQVGSTYQGKMFSKFSVVVTSVLIVRSAEEHIFMS
jgi:hypothetical protein